MINSIQTTNFNPAFNAKLQVTPRAANYLAKTKRVPQDQLELQTKALKEMGNDNIAITIRRFFEDMRDGLSVEVNKLVNGKVYSGETKAYFFNPKSSFDLVTMALKASANAGEDQTKSPDMFKFM